MRSWILDKGIQIKEKKMIERISRLLQEFVIDKTINGNTVKTIQFFNDTVKNLKPIFDRHGGKLESDPYNQDSILNVYMPVDEFVKLFEQALINGNATDEELLDSMIAYDDSRKFGHGVFLRYAKEKNSQRA